MSWHSVATGVGPGWVLASARCGWRVLLIGCGRCSNYSHRLAAALLIPRICLFSIHHASIHAVIHTRTITSPSHSVTHATACFFDY